MKKILMLLGIFAIYINIFAAGGCDMDLYPMSNTTSPIELWGESYQPCYMYEWDVTFPTDWHYVEFCYTIDMNPIGAIDAVMIYIQDEDGQEHDIINYPYKPITGCITVPLHTNSARVVCLSEYGNAGGLYRGFKLHYRQGNATPSNHVFFSNVGIGTYPRETLHVNGAIRGGGENGEVTLKGDNGYVTIGATNQAMEFNTDKPQFAFNKPLYGSGTYGVLQIKTSKGDMEIGPTDTGYAHFKTNMSTYHFDRRLLLHTGELTSETKFTFVTGKSTHCMTMLTNGNVGIRTQNPSYNFDVNGDIRAKKIYVTSALLAKEIQADEIKVKTSGADFVFDKDYQLRPLSEVKAFIRENQHLPEIKSAQEMQEDGVSVSELQTQLLQKIEELTLYLIQQEQTIQELRQEVEQLKK